MFSRLEVINSAGSTLTLPLENEGTGYIIKDIDGLGPVKASIATSKFANFDGTQYQSASRDSRNITIKLALEPDYATQSVQSLRQAAYAYFLPKLPVTLRFKVDKKIIYEIAGYVESCDPPLFTKEPEVDISIICPLPDFVDADTVAILGSSVSDSTETPLVYTGSVETGFLFTLLPNAPFSSFTLNVRKPNGVLQTLTYSDSLINLDSLAISTVSQAKSATLTRASVQTNKMNKVAAASVWMPIWPGTNLIRVAIAGSSVPYTISYKNRYGGL